MRAGVHRKRANGIRFGSAAALLACVLGGCGTAPAIPDAPRSPTTTTAAAAERTDEPPSIQTMVRDHVRARNEEVQRCADGRWRMGRAPKGTVRAKFTIADDGRVVAAKVVESDFADTQVGACVLERLRGWRFPTAGRGLVVVTYPFILRPDSTSAPASRGFVSPP